MVVVDRSLPYSHYAVPYVFLLYKENLLLSKSSARFENFSFFF